MQLPDGMTVSAEDMALAETWVDLTADLLTVGSINEDVNMVNEVTSAVNAVAEAANSRYAQMDGGSVSFTLDDLGGFLGMFEDSIRLGYLDCTADLLMASQDGPRATGNHLRDAINKLEEAGKND